MKLLFRKNTPNLLPDTTAVETKDVGSSKSKCKVKKKSNSAPEKSDKSNGHIIKQNGSIKTTIQNGALKSNHSNRKKEEILISSPVPDSFCRSPHPFEEMGKKSTANVNCQNIKNSKEKQIIQSQDCSTTNRNSDMISFEDPQKFVNGPLCYPINIIPDTAMQFHEEQHQILKQDWLFFLEKVPIIHWVKKWACLYEDKLLIYSVPPTQSATNNTEIDHPTLITLTPYDQQLLHHPTYQQQPITPSFPFFRQNISLKIPAPLALENTNIKNLMCPQNGELCQQNGGFPIVSNSYHYYPPPTTTTVMYSFALEIEKLFEAEEKSLGVKSGPEASDTSTGTGSSTLRRRRKRRVDYLTMAAVQPHDRSQWVQSFSDVLSYQRSRATGTLLRFRQRSQIAPQIVTRHSNNLESSSPNQSNEFRTRSLTQVVYKSLNEKNATFKNNLMQLNGGISEKASSTIQNGIQSSNFHKSPQSRSPNNNPPTQPIDSTINQGETAYSPLRDDLVLILIRNKRELKRLETELYQLETGNSSGQNIVQNQIDPRRQHPCFLLRQTIAKYRNAVTVLENLLEDQQQQILPSPPTNNNNNKIELKVSGIEFAALTSPTNQPLKPIIQPTKSRNYGYQTCNNNNNSAPIINALRDSTIESKTSIIVTSAHSSLNHSKMATTAICNDHFNNDDMECLKQDYRQLIDAVTNLTVPNFSSFSLRFEGLMGQIDKQLKNCLTVGDTPTNNHFQSSKMAPTADPRPRTLSELHRLRTKLVTLRDKVYRFFADRDELSRHHSFHSVTSPALQNSSNSYSSDIYYPTRTSYPRPNLQTYQQSDNKMGDLAVSGRDPYPQTHSPPPFSSSGSASSFVPVRSRQKPDDYFYFSSSKSSTVPAAKTSLNDKNHIEETPIPPRPIMHSEELSLCRSAATLSNVGGLVVNPMRSDVNLKFRNNEFRKCNYVDLDAQKKQRSRSVPPAPAAKQSPTLIPFAGATKNIDGSATASDFLSTSVSYRRTPSYTNMKKYQTILGHSNRRSYFDATATKKTNINHKEFCSTSSPPYLENFKNSCDRDRGKELFYAFDYDNNQTTPFYHAKQEQIPKNLVSNHTTEAQKICDEKAAYNNNKDVISLERIDLQISKPNKIHIPERLKFNGPAVAHSHAEDEKRQTRYPRISSYLHTGGGNSFEDSSSINFSDSSEAPPPSNRRCDRGDVSGPETFSPPDMMDDDKMRKENVKKAIKKEYLRNLLSNYNIQDSVCYEKQLLLQTTTTTDSKYNPEHCYTNLRDINNNNYHQDESSCNGYVRSERNSSVASSQPYRSAQLPGSQISNGNKEERQRLAETLREERERRERLLSLNEMLAKEVAAKTRDLALRNNNNF